MANKNKPIRISIEEAKEHYDQGQFAGDAIVVHTLVGRILPVERVGIR